MVATVSISVLDNKTVAKSTTDEDGNYKLSGLAAGRFNILPLAKSYIVASDGGAASTASFGAGGPFDYVLHLMPGSYDVHLTPYQRDRCWSWWPIGPG